ncbi:hypothetical protein PT974_10056 [Cladobotryum mycophilum]|uniref:Xylanolytic transcriptional activator regulatory domain-containing protein n=1 Tax=Cladobotryum mycophilum TaxID=491253 RepID=A0ABR0S8S5_9HYPO
MHHQAFDGTSQSSSSPGVTAPTDGGEGRPPASREEGEIPTHSWCGVAWRGVAWRGEARHMRSDTSRRLNESLTLLQVTSDVQHVPVASSVGTRAFTHQHAASRARPVAIIVVARFQGGRRGLPALGDNTDQLTSSQGRKEASVGPQSPNEHDSSTTVSASTSGPAPSQEPTSIASPASSQGTASRADYPTQLNVLPEEEEYLLGKYLELMHDAIPIFSRARFTPSLRASLYSRDLILTMIVITARLTGFKFASDNFDIDARIDFMLSSGSLQEAMFGDSPSLDQFRKACLLAFYEFHQFPGQQAWMRIGKITRIAYWIGLDRLENNQAIYPDWAAMSEEEVEDWRFVWWCVYRLDSYANLAAGTPYLIDETMVNTALLRDQPWDRPPGSQLEPLKQKVYLPSQPDSLWELIPSVATDSPQTLIFNLHIITVTAMRQCARVMQLHKVRPGGEILSLLSTMNQRLCAHRLALPTNYLNPRRNALSNESALDHHARLVTILHLHMARFIISILSCIRLGEGEKWLLSWQEILETCQDIAAISEQWDSSFSLSVDPAISFIIFTAIIFLDLHKKSTPSVNADLQANCEHYQTVLLLQLEHFASIWTVPKLLSLSFKSVRESVKGPLTYRQVQYVLSRFESPLHPRWLQFLSSAHTNLEAADEAHMDI